MVNVFCATLLGLAFLEESRKDKIRSKVVSVLFYLYLFSFS